LSAACSSDSILRSCMSSGDAARQPLRSHWASLSRRRSSRKATSRSCRSIPASREFSRAMSLSAARVLRVKCARGGGGGTPAAGSNPSTPSTEAESLKSLGIDAAAGVRGQAQREREHECSGTSSRKAKIYKSLPGPVDAPRRSRRAACTPSHRALCVRPARSSAACEDAMLPPASVPLPAPLPHPAPAPRMRPVASDAPPHLCRHRAPPRRRPRPTASPPAG